MPLKHVLILGGTTEARTLAQRITAELSGKARVTTSLAGALGRRPELPGDVRVGGFGGIGGLVDYIAEAGVDLVVDATHPFSAQISDHANAACAAAGINRLQLLRAPWRMPPKAQWLDVADMADAAEALSRFAGRVFVTTGARGLDALSALESLFFLIRVIEPPAEPPPLANFEIITGRPPYPLEDERRILAEHKIDTLLTKEAGGDATAAKITAAAELGVKIVLIRRPPPEPGAVVDNVDDAFAWVERYL